MRCWVRSPLVPTVGLSEYGARRTAADAASTAPPSTVVGAVSRSEFVGRGAITHPAVS